MCARAMLQFVSERVGVSGGAAAETRTPSSDGPSTPRPLRRGGYQADQTKTFALAGPKRAKAKKKNEDGKKREARKKVETKVVRTGCVYFLKGCCARGGACPYAHATKSDRHCSAVAQPEADQAKAQGSADVTTTRVDNKNNKKTTDNDSTTDHGQQLPRRMTIEYDDDEEEDEKDADDRDLESGGSESEVDDEVATEGKNGEEAEKVDFFEELPPELAWLVAGRLEHQDLGRLASTCHRMAGLVSDPLLWKLNYDRVWGASSTTDLESDSSASGGVQSASATSAPPDNSMEDNSEGLGDEAEERGKEIGEGMRGGPLAGDDVSSPSLSPDVARESGSEDEGTTKNEDVQVEVEVVRMTERKSEAKRKAKTTAVAKKAERDWREEYRARLEYEHRGWKAKNIHRLSKKVTNVETHHNATFITSLAVNRPPILEPAKMTKVKASCFVLVVDRMTSSLHRKDDYLAIAPNWELDNGIVRVIEMKSYKKKKTVILRPHAIPSPLLARFSSAHGDGRMAIAPQQEPGVVEVWDWANDQMLHQFPVSSHATAMDFCYNDIILGDASGPVALYDVRRRGSAPTSVLSGHTDKVTCMQRRDDTLATGSGDGTVRVWDLRQGSAPMFQLEGHSISFVSSLQFDSQKLIFSAVHSPPSHYFWQNARDRNPFRHQMLHVWNARTFEFWNSLDFSKARTTILGFECAEATSPMSFDFEGNFLVVGVPRQVVMLNFYNNAHCIES